LGLSHQILVHFFLVSHAWHMFRPAHYTWLHLPNNIRSCVQNMKLLITESGDVYNLQYRNLTPCSNCQASACIYIDVTFSLSNCYKYFSIICLYLHTRVRRGYFDHGAIWFKLRISRVAHQVYIKSFSSLLLR
jgi:hypothetical protein